jgi:type I restriction enzyme S subunit
MHIPTAAGLDLAQSIDIMIREGYVARVAPAVGVEGSWLRYWLESPDVQWWLTSSSKEVARKTLNLGDLAKLPVPMPAQEEQAEIVHRVETLFAFADRLEARLRAAQIAAERLTPALLAKAFRGELVPQDPNDEPASELLRRLRAEVPSSKPARGRRATL